MAAGPPIGLSLRSGHLGARSAMQAYSPDLRRLDPLTADGDSGLLTKTSWQLHFSAARFAWIHEVLLQL